MSDKVDKIFKIYEERNHADAPKAAKIKSLVECNATCIDTLLKMKHGAFTTIKLALDSEKVSDCIFTFRVLTGREEQNILDEMAKTGYNILDIRYQIHYVALTLSKASSPFPSFKDHTQPFNSPELSVDDLKTIPKNYLLALGYHYKEFIEKHSPKIEALTQEQIDECIEMIQKCEDDIKKFELLNTWNLNAIPEVLIDSVKKLTKLTKQVEAACIG